MNPKRGRDHTCPMCGAVFYRPPSGLRAKHGVNYCSQPCAMKGRTLGLTPRVCEKPYQLDQSPEAVARRMARNRKSMATRKARGFVVTERTRRKLSKRTTESMKRRMSEGTGVSELENDVAKALDILGVGYVRQFKIIEGQKLWGMADFFLDDGRLLEFNGSYFHSDPRLYPDGPGDAIQRRTETRWVAKQAACERLGYDVLVLWEMDWKERGIDALREVLACED